MKNPILQAIETLSIKEIAQLIKSSGNYSNFSDRAFDEMILSRRPMDLLLQGEAVLTCSPEKEPVREIHRQAMELAFRNYVVDEEEDDDTTASESEQ